MAIVVVQHRKNITSWVKAIYELLYWGPFGDRKWCKISIIHRRSACKVVCVIVACL